MHPDEGHSAAGAASTPTISRMDEQDITDIPAGDVHWDGTVMTVGGRELTRPGRYRLIDNGNPISIIEVLDDED